MGRRIIIHRDNPGHWSAWFADLPQVSWGGPSMLVALGRLGDSLTVEENRRMRTVAGPEELAAGRVKILISEPCEDCGGSGIYVGLMEREICQACRGVG